MSRINTNVTSLAAERMLGMNKASLNKSLERLSTGIRINRGSDDPAGLIASNNLGSELRSINAAVGNAERADQVVGIAEGGLQEVSGLLEELQGLITSTASSAGLSKEEKQANQLQIDSILQTIDRISAATSFQGIKLLNGNFDFKTSGVSTGITDYKINSAKFSGDSLRIDVQVTQSAQQAGLVMSVGGANLNLAGSNQFVIEVTGAKGSRELTFSDNTSLDSIMSSINTFTATTGVQAAVSGTALRIESAEFGTDQFVNVKIVNAGGLTTEGSIADLDANDFNSLGSNSYNFSNSATTNGVRDQGQNIRATVNGVAATTDGKNIRVNTDFLDVGMTMATGQAQTLGSVNAFSITGGGANFQLGGKVDIGSKVSLGIADVAVRKLGDSSLGFLSSLASGQANNVINGDLTAAQKIVGESTAQISGLRGRLGAFQKNTIGATVRSLNVASENTAAAQSVIRDADFAKETAGLTRSQILVSSATQILTLANQQPQSVLQLLG